MSGLLQKSDEVRKKLLKQLKKLLTKIDELDIIVKLFQTAKQRTLII